MGPQGHLGALLDGMGCTVCEEHVPAERIRLLARRDDLLFLQVACPACGSTSLGFGPERMALMKHGINDIRLFYENDVRFLNQF